MKLNKFSQKRFRRKINLLQLKYVVRNYNFYFFEELNIKQK